MMIKTVLTSLFLLCLMAGAVAASPLKDIEKKEKKGEISLCDDLRAEIKEIEETANNGNLTSLLTIGDWYATGKYVNQSHRKAMKWYRKAAELNLEFAQVNIGNYYYHGLGTEKDMRKAYKWYSLAARQQNPIAKEMLEKMQYEMPEIAILQANQMVDDFLSKHRSKQQ